MRCILVTFGLKHKRIANKLSNFFKTHILLNGYAIIYWHTYIYICVYIKLCNNRFLKNSNTSTVCNFRSRIKYLMIILQLVSISFQFDRSKFSIMYTLGVCVFSRLFALSFSLRWLCMFLILYKPAICSHLFEHFHVCSNAHISHVYRANW